MDEDAATVVVGELVAPVPIHEGTRLPDREVVAVNDREAVAHRFQLASDDGDVVRGRHLDPV